MKKIPKSILFLVILANSLVVIDLFEMATVQDPNSGNATADQVEGYYIFLMSKPVKAYEYLGSVKAGLTWNGQPEQDFKSVLKKVKKDFPKADGIIFQDISLKKVDAIKFK